MHNKIQFGLQQFEVKDLDYSELDHVSVMCSQEDRWSEESECEIRTLDISYELVEEMYHLMKENGRG